MTLIVSIFPIDSEYLLLDYQPGLPLPKSFPVDLDGGCLRSSAGLFSDPFSLYLALKLKKCGSLMKPSPTSFACLASAAFSTTLWRIFASFYSPRVPSEMIAIYQLSILPLLIIIYLYYSLDLSFVIITYRTYFQLSCVIMFEYYSS